MCPNAPRRNFTTGTEVLSEFQQEPKQIQMRAEPSLRVASCLVYTVEPRPV